MLKIYFLLCFSLSSYMMSQTNDNLIVGKKQNLYYSYSNENIIITNDESDTYFSGIINFSTNEGGIRIKPIANYKIIIKPLNKNYENKDDINSALDADGTVIGSRKPGTSSKPPERSLSIDVTPIPTNRFLNVFSNTELCNYYIFDTIGNLKAEKKLTCSQRFQVDVSFLSKGNYIIILETKNTNRITKNFIKN